MSNEQPKPGGAGKIPAAKPASVSPATQVPAKQAPAKPSGAASGTPDVSAMANKALLQASGKAPRTALSGADEVVFGKEAKTGREHGKWKKWLLEQDDQGVARWVKVLIAIVVVVVLSFVGGMFWANWSTVRGR